MNAYAANIIVNLVSIVLWLPFFLLFDATILIIVHGGIRGFEVIILISMCLITRQFKKRQLTCSYLSLILLNVCLFILFAAALSFLIYLNNISLITLFLGEFLVVLGMWIWLTILNCMMVKDKRKEVHLRDSVRENEVYRQN